MNYDEILKTADFETFLQTYYSGTIKTTTVRTGALEIDWADIYRYDPDVADAALEREADTIAAIRDALATVAPDHFDTSEGAVSIHNRPSVDQSEADS